MDQQDRTHYVIVGMMGVGKTTTGRALARELNCDYVDSDKDIETLLGCSGRLFTEEKGVAALHEVESAVLLGALRTNQTSVITAAASVVESEIVRFALKRRSTVVRLVMSHQETIERQKMGSHRRAMSLDELEKLAQRREHWFDEVSDLSISATLQVEEIVEEILKYSR